MRSARYNNVRKRGNLNIYIYIYNLEIEKTVHICRSEILEDKIYELLR